MEAANEVLRDLAEITSLQRDQFDKVEQDVQKADESSLAAVGCLADSIKIQSRTRTKKAMLGGVGAFAVTGAIAGAALGPPGSAAGFLAGAIFGAAVGGGLGAGVGYGVGKALDQSSSIDLELIALSNSKFFIPFDSTKYCMICQKFFHPFNKPHHCRVCGRVCCHDCSSEMVEILYQDLLNPVSARICKVCRQKNPNTHSFNAGSDPYKIIIKEVHNNESMIELSSLKK
jgi:hypothetical protein